MVFFNKNFPASCNCVVKLCCCLFAHRMLINNALLLKAPELQGKMNPELLKEPEKKHLIRVRGKLLSLKEPVVMGILNATPDSFHAASRVMDQDEALKQAEKHLKEGAHMLDLGAYSSRPGATDISEDEERRRLLPLVEKISRTFPEAPL